MKKLIEKNGFRDFYPVIFLAATLCYMLFIYAPITVYISNSMDFCFDIYELLKYMLPFSICVFVLCTAISTVLYLISKKTYNIWCVLFTGGLVATFVHGVFFASGLPLLDGADIDWAQYKVSYIISALIWCVSIVCVAMIYIRTKKTAFITCISIAMLFFLVLTLAFNGIGNKTAFEKKSDTSMTSNGFLEMSSNGQNFVILLLDAVDGTEFDNMLYDNPNYEELFNDFTLFTNTMSYYPYTTRSVPYILFGNKYDNTLWYPYWVKESIENSPFFAKLTSEGYQKTVFFEYIQRADIDDGVFKNFEEMDSFASPVKFCKMVLKLVGMQFAPYVLKPYCVLTPDDVYWDTLKTLGDREIDYYSFDNKDLYERIQSKEVSVLEKNCFSLIYANGAHTPYLYDKDIKPTDNSDYRQSLEASVTLASAYIQKLKAAGVYDNSVVVIMSDHGINVEEPSSQYKKQHPFMMIKGIGEHHDLRKDDAPISHCDLQEAFIKLCNGALSDSCFNWHEGDIRERIHLQSDVTDTSEITEYVSTSHAGDYEALKPTGNVFTFDWLTAVPQGAKLEN